MMKKIPWGIIAGVCLVFVIYLTAGIIVGWVILDRIEAETTGNVSGGLADSPVCGRRSRRRGDGRFFGYVHKK